MNPMLILAIVAIILLVIAVVVAYLIKNSLQTRYNQVCNDLYYKDNICAKQASKIDELNNLLNEKESDNRQLKNVNERILADLNRVTEDKSKLSIKNNELINQNSDLNNKRGMLEVEISRFNSENIRFKEDVELLRVTERDLSQQNRSKTDEISQLKQQITSLDVQIKGFKERAELIDKNNRERQEQFVTVFENIAQDIIEKRSEKFLLSSRDSVSKIVEPLSRELSEFGKKVEQQFVENTKDSASLRSELSKLMELNHKLDSEAKSLVKAIKGEYNPKIQGDWGEMILEKILINSGLQQDEHYFLQESNRDDDGSILRPDVVVRYPDGREVIIDSKVSMTAYMRYTAATNELEMRKAESDHIVSVRRHIDSLSSKRYDYKEESLDFVMMFMAVEPAYILALTVDKELWEYAYKRKILLVTPTHLITALKLIYDLWSRDAQNKNAEEIAKRGALMLDKFAGFVADMETIKRNIDTTSKSYDNAMNKLSTGSGNLIRQAEMLSDLGVRSSKQLKSGGNALKTNTPKSNSVKISPKTAKDDLESDIESKVESNIESKVESKVEI